MDELIELIIRAIAALFENRQKQTRLPPLPPLPPPATPPRSTGQGNAPARQLHTPPAQRPMLQRRAAVVKKQIKRPQPAQPGRAKVPPLPPMTQPPTAVAGASTAPRGIATAPATASPAISAGAIRQLIKSRPAALRSMWVLSEVLQPPLSLRDSDPSHPRLIHNSLTVRSGSDERF